MGFKSALLRTIPAQSRRTEKRVSRVMSRGRVILGSREAGRREWVGGSEVEAEGRRECS